jgi:uncharacterized protein (DUF2236 family)
VTDLYSVSRYSAKSPARAVAEGLFLHPAGPALYAPDSLAWRIFKNAVSLFIGGITACCSRPYQRAAT